MADAGSDSQTTGFVAFQHRDFRFVCIFGKANEERYMSPIVQAPSLIIHSKDVVFDDANILYTQGFALNRVGWVK
jgi:hypothetical protein